MKGLILEIYKNRGNTFSNGGLSERCDEVFLVGDNIPEVFEDSKDRPAVKIDFVQIGMSRHYFVRPIEDSPKGTVGWMAGGSYVYVSDSRFPFEYPLALHDRTETQAEYEMYST